MVGESPPIEIPDDLIDGLAPGIAHPGPTFLAGHVSFQLGFIIEFAKQWKDQKPGAHLLNHDDSEAPWKFKEFVMSVPSPSSALHKHTNKLNIQREALLHLVFPDTFEPMVSIRHKNKIAKTFSKFVTQPTDDVDRKLAQIRRGLEVELGGDFGFYDDGIYEQWINQTTGNGNLWDEFVRRAREYVDSGRLESEEISYKIERGRKLVQAREAVLAGADGWGSLVKSGIAGNLIFPIQQAKFRDWIDESAADALIALQALWAQDDSSVVERVRDFADLFSSSVVSGLGTRANVASVLLAGLDVERYPPFMISVFNEAYKRTGYDQLEQGADEAALYERALGFLDRFIEEASKRGLTLRHPLDAQSVVWGIQYKGGGAT